MPEGHVTHRIVRDHTPLLVGGPVRVSSPQGRFTADAALIDGQVLTSIEAYGKHLFYWWDNGLVGHVHLGLIGRFRVSPGPAAAVQGQVRMRLASELATIDLSGPSDCRVFTPDDREAIVARLGPDPLRRDARPQVAIERMASSRQPIGQVLLDQRVLAGVGNVFRAEALFVLGIDPRRPARDCSSDELQSLWETLVAMLRKGVKDNRIVTINRRRFPVPREAAKRGDTTYVYHRDVCLECATPVQTVELGGRACYYCPTCQK
jgi:endonuclease-8